MSSSVVAALEGVDKLRKELEGLRKEVRELEVQLTIARGAAKSAVRERDFQLKQVSQLKCRLRVYEPEPTKAELAQQRRAKRQRKEAAAAAAAAAEQCQ